tara:strand:- start:538 stop:642 length:105 start_codon:yes stop_codon:yes gene_type:complete
MISSGVDMASEAAISSLIAFGPLSGIPNPEFRPG